MRPDYTFGASKWNRKIQRCRSRPAGPERCPAGAAAPGSVPCTVPREKASRADQLRPAPRRVMGFKAMRKATTLALLLALLLPAAAAARVVAPPGNSEADQYFETLPASTGPRSPDSTKKARDAVRDGALSEAAERALRKRGPAGLAVATAVAKTAPPRRPGGGRSPSPASTVRIPGRQGLGALFPLILVAMVGGAVAFAVARRRPAPRPRLGK